MCVTEVWTYSECGCHYNNSVLCRAYRRDHSPFPPNVQYRVDEWLQETGADPELAFRQFKRLARPLDPQDCPQHSIVQKSFLNQICEDCLLTKLDAEPLTLDHSSPTPLSPLTIPDNNGEGLIWDSEVKVEIQSQTSASGDNHLQPNFGPLIDLSEEDDKRILESHVEVTIETDNHSIPTEDFSSPAIPISNNGDSSRVSSVATSPPSPSFWGSRQPKLPAYRSKRYGQTFHDTTLFTDFDEADDEYDDHEQHYQPSPPLSRGRSLTRGKFFSSQRRETSPGPPTPIVDSETGRPSLSRFKSLKSLSNPFRNGPKGKEDEEEEAPLPPPPAPAEVVGEDDVVGPDSVSSLPPAPPSPKPKSIKIFRGLRSRRSSPLIVAPAETTPALPDVPNNFSNNRPSAISNHSFPAKSNPTNANQEILADSEAGEADDGSGLPPRKSSLMNWAQGMVQDLKKNRRAVRSRSRPRDSPRSRAPSPSDAGRRQRIELFDATLESDSHALSPSEDEFDLVRLESARTVAIRPFSPFAFPASPKSHSTDTTRAAMNGYIDLDFGLGNETQVNPNTVAEVEVSTDEKPAPEPSKRLEASTTSESALEIYQNPTFDTSAKGERSTATESLQELNPHPTSDASARVDGNSGRESLWLLDPNPLPEISKQAGPESAGKSSLTQIAEQALETPATGSANLIPETSTQVETGAIHDIFTCIEPKVDPEITKLKVEQIIGETWPLKAGIFEERKQEVEDSIPAEILTAERISVARRKPMDSTAADEASPAEVSSPRLTSQQSTGRGEPKAICRRPVHPPRSSSLKIQTLSSPAQPSDSDGSTSMPPLPLAREQVGD